MATHVPNIKRLPGVYRDDPAQFVGGVDGRVSHWGAGEAGRVRRLGAVQVGDHLLKERRIEGGK